MFQCDSAEVTDKSVLDLLQPAARTSFARLVASTSAPGRRNENGQPSTFIAVRASGEQFPFECSLSYLRLRDGGVFTLIGRDITERVRSEKALKTQAEQLGGVDV